METVISIAATLVAGTTRIEERTGYFGYEENVSEEFPVRKGHPGELYEPPSSEGYIVPGWESFSHIGSWLDIVVGNAVAFSVNVIHISIRPLGKAFVGAIATQIANELYEVVKKIRATRKIEKDIDITIYGPDGKVIRSINTKSID